MKDPDETSIQATGYPATTPRGSTARWDGTPIYARHGTAIIADSLEVPQYWARPHVGRIVDVIRLERAGEVWYILDNDGARQKIYQSGGYWNSGGGHYSLAIQPDSWEWDGVEQNRVGERRQQPKRQQQPQRRPGKAKGAIRAHHATGAEGDPNQPVRAVPLNEDQIAQMRQANPGVDLAIAQALGSPGAVTVWAAHGKRSSLLVVVTTPKEGSDEKPDITVDYVDGGTEWDRKQRTRKAIAETVAEGQRLGYKATRL